MSTQAGERHQQIVSDYFTYIKDLRAGDARAVEKLVGLWDDDGVFEFAGSPPVSGTFRGRMAIHTLYKNRLQAKGMTLRLEGAGKQAHGQRDVALGVVDTEVNRTRVMDNKVVAGWTTTIGTSDARGFRVAGSHAFTFKDGKISGLKVVVSPRPDAAPNLNIDGLAVDDIGRLALAAWPVV